MCAASHYSYYRWDGTQRIFEPDEESAMDEMADDLIAHGDVLRALRDADAIAALPWLQVLDFGLMDFISGHHGAIPSAAMKSPGQFDHALVARGKANVVAAALANGVTTLWQREYR